MALTAATIATIATVAKVATATVAVAGTTASISAQQTAKKRAASQRQQAERIRTGDIKRTEALAERAEALPKKAKTQAAAIAAGRQRRRGTLKTGARGLLDEPIVSKPGLLGL